MRHFCQYIGGIKRDNSENTIFMFCNLLNVGREVKHAGESPTDFLSRACSCVLSNTDRAGLYWTFKAQDLKQKAKLQRESVARSYIIFINSFKSVTIIFKGQEKDLCQLQR